MFRSTWLFFFLFSFSLQAQRLDYRYDHLDLRQAANVNRISIIGFDEKGIGWFLTEKGIARYDGYSVKLSGTPFGGFNAMLDRTVSGSFLGEDGKIYLAYFESGMSVYDPENDRWTHELPDTANENAFPAAMISRIKVEKDGTIYLLTWGDGFYQRKAGERAWNQFMCDKNDSTKLSSPLVKELIQDRDGTYLVGTWEEDSRDNYFQQWDPATGRFSRFPIDEYIAHHSDAEKDQILISLRIIHSIFIDRNDNLWIASYSGLVFIDRKNKKAQRVSSSFKVNYGNLENTRLVEEGPDGILWVATQSSGILVVDPDTRKCVNLVHDVNLLQGISDDRIRNIKKDKMGNLWISTGSGMIDILVPIRQRFRIISNVDLKVDFWDRSAEIMPLKNVAVDYNGKLYAMSFSGISVYDLTDNRIDRFIDLTAIQSRKQKLEGPLAVHFKVAHSITPLPSGDLLMGTRSALVRFDPQSDEIKKTWGFGNYSVDHFQWSKDSSYIWFIGYHQRELRKYNVQQDEVELVDTFDPALPLNYSSFFDLHDGRLLIQSAQRNGFFIYSVEDKTFQHWSPENPEYFFPDSSLLFMNEDHEKNVWITSETGVYKFNRKTNKVENWHDKIGLNGKTASVFFVDAKGIFWLGLDDGLLRYDPRTGERFLFGRGMGCDVGVFSHARPAFDKEGRVYLATLKGVLILEPDKIQANFQVPDLQLNRIIIQHDTLENSALKNWLAGKKKLSHNQNSFVFEWHTDQLYMPEPHQYYYRLMGQDTIWKSTEGQNKVKFANMPSGNYVFQLRAINAYGVETELLEIPFLIDLPLWWKWWFLLLELILLVLFIYWIIKMRVRLLKKEKERLENQVLIRTNEVLVKAREISQKNEIIESKNKEMTDSIRYAKNIQQAMMNNATEFRKLFPESYILFKPKDIVSGDFYWFAQKDDCMIWAVVDCTGHGVPGGFMTMLGSSFLNQIVNEAGILEPNRILDLLREKVIDSLNQSLANGSNRDGMDISLVRYTPSKKQISYAGANNPLYIIRNGQLIESKADKQPIGIHGGEMKPFSITHVDVIPGDILIASTDGYADQFGGEKGKKLKSRNFEKLLLELSSQSMKQQEEALHRWFLNWKADYEQVDDVCVISVKIG